MLARTAVEESGREAARCVAAHEAADTATATAAERVREVQAQFMTRLSELGFGSSAEFDAAKKTIPQVAQMESDVRQFEADLVAAQSRMEHASQNAAGLHPPTSKESTRSTSEADIMRYLVPAFDMRLLNAISREQMQDLLNQKAQELSESVVAHLRWHLNAIFKMAQSDGAVPFNPAAALYIPACKQAPAKRVLTKQDVRRALSVLDVRERLVFRMAVFNGLRPGEIFAIQLGKVASNSVVVDLRIYGSHLDTPKGRKGRRTERLVGLSPGTVRDLELWRRFLGDRSEEAFLFPSETGQTPLRPNNHWKRDMKPRLEKVGLEWVNFQVLRRTHASLSRKAKVDDKVSADQRGHGLGVSLGVYAISDLEQKIDAVTKLESDVFADSEMI